MTMDPLRVRIRFFEAIRPTDRLAVIQDARDKLQSHLVRVTDMAKEDRRRGDIFRYLAIRGGMLAIRAQIAWLREVEVMIECDAAT